MAARAPRYNLASVAAPLAGASAAWLFLAAGFDGFYSLPVWKVAVALGLTGGACLAGLARVGARGVVAGLERRWAWPSTPCCPC
jgi:hypothetical protein